MSQPRARIASQLGVALAIVLALVISGSTLFALRSLDDANLATRQAHLGSEARLLADQLETFHSSLRTIPSASAGCSSAASPRACRCMPVKRCRSPGRQHRRCTWVIIC